MCRYVNCDACGKTISKGEESRDTPFAKFTAPFYSIRATSTIVRRDGSAGKEIRKEIELCPDCKTKLFEFLHIKDEVDADE